MSILDGPELEKDAGRIAPDTTVMNIEHPVAAHVMLIATHVTDATRHLLYDGVQVIPLSLAPCSGAGS
jgi:hypothetical protein